MVCLDLKRKLLLNAQKFSKPTTLSRRFYFKFVANLFLARIGREIFPNTDGIEPNEGHARVKDALGDIGGGVGFAGVADAQDGIALGCVFGDGDFDLVEREDVFHVAALRMRSFAFRVRSALPFIGYLLDKFVQNNSFCLTAIP